MKRVAIVQSNYIPWKGYFDLINLVDEFILLDDVQYTKCDWRNRNTLKTPSGSKWISIPVSLKHSGEPIKNVTVADSDWLQKHWNKIVPNYNKARFYHEYKPLFEELYANKDEKYLSRINYRFITAICSILSINTTVSWSMDYRLHGDKSQRLVNLCNQAGADEYLSGPAAKCYLDESLFHTEGIKVQWMDYGGYPEYDQLFSPPFIHQVSIIDMILNLGAEGTRKHMLSFPESIYKSKLCRPKSFGFIKNPE